MVAGEAASSPGSPEASVSEPCTGAAGKGRVQHAGFLPPLPMGRIGAMHC